MARTACLVAVLALAFIGLAASQCIECKDCKGSNTCLSMCKQSCAPPGINIEACKSVGTKMGEESAKFACDLTMQYCQALVQPRSYMPQPRVSLQQCGNAAYGVCQAFTLDANKSPCGKSFNGVAKCSKQEFAKFYNGVAEEQCNAKAAVFDKQPPAPLSAEKGAKSGRRMF